MNLYDIIIEVKQSIDNISGYYQCFTLYATSEEDGILFLPNFLKNEQPELDFVIDEIELLNELEHGGKTKIKNISGKSYF